MSEYTDVISLGAGVQSSTLLMMADRGELKIDGEAVIPEFAVMSDTGNEPEKVYEWLEYLKTQVKNIKIIVTKNGDIIQDTLEGIKDNKRFASVPFYTLTPAKRMPIYDYVGVEMPIEDVRIIDAFKDVDTDDMSPEQHDEMLAIFKKYEKYRKIVGYKDVPAQKGVLWRQCTGEYKINAVRKEMKRLLGYKSRQTPKETIRMWMGISTDEIQRIKPSGVKYIENYYPLIEENMNRFDCLKWFRNNNMPLPPKSACIICPYHSDKYWLDMKRNDRDSWDMAVEFDKKIRTMPKLEAQLFLHKSCQPLGEVDLREDQVEFELEGFDNVCEGMCGL